MPKTIVEIEWDGPDDVNWLCPDNIELALHAYCKNTKFIVALAKNNITETIEVCHEHTSAMNSDQSVFVAHDLTREACRREHHS